MTCAIDGCSGVVKARGLCWRHYQRLRRTGTTDLRRPGAIDLLPSQAVTHCHRGHEYTPDNTYTRNDGRRMCRTCMRWRQQERQQRDLSALKARIRDAGLVDDAQVKSAYVSAYNRLTGAQDES